MAPPGSTLDKLFASGFGAVIAVAHASQIVKDKSYEQYAKRGGFTLNAIDAAKALASKYPALSEETMATGMLSAARQIPDEDLDTIGLEWLLVAQSKTVDHDHERPRAHHLREQGRARAGRRLCLARSNRPTTDKDAFIVAHPGAAEYINDDTKSFMDRYSDMMYLGAAALSVIGSIFAGIYTKVTRIAPEKASELATAILDIGERMEYAKTLDALDELQDELEAILRGAVIGLRDGTISSDGLDTFKLGYEFVRDEIGMRRDHLKRHPQPRKTIQTTVSPTMRRQCRGREDRAERVSPVRDPEAARSVTPRRRSNRRNPRPDLGDLALERRLPRIGQCRRARFRRSRRRDRAEPARRRKSAWPGRR